MSSIGTKSTADTYEEVTLKMIHEQTLKDLEALPVNDCYKGDWTILAIAEVGLAARLGTASTVLTQLKEKSQESGDMFDRLHASFFKLMTEMTEGTTAGTSAGAADGAGGQSH